MSRIVLPFLINRAAGVEMAGRRVRKGETTMRAELTGTVRAHPLAAVVLFAAIGYALAPRSVRKTRPPR